MLLCLKIQYCCLIAFELQLPVNSKHIDDTRGEALQEKLTELIDYWLLFKFSIIGDSLSKSLISWEYIDAIGKEGYDEPKTQENPGHWCGWFYWLTFNRRIDNVRA
jgi:hypothetical protein